MTYYYNFDSAIIFTTTLISQRRRDNTPRFHGMTSFKGMVVIYELILKCHSKMIKIHNFDASNKG